MSFPAPGDRLLETSLDLNTLVKNPAATFFMRVEGNAMTSDGLHHGDLLLVDRSLSPAPGKLVVAVVDGELVIRRLVNMQGDLQLQSPIPNSPPIAEYEVWGVVSTVIHSV